MFLQATALIKDICRNLHAATKSIENADYTVVLRGDSTLRGHFPEARTVTLTIFDYLRYRVINTTGTSQII